MGAKLSLPPVEDDGKDAEIESLRKKLAEAMSEFERERSEKERERSEKELLALMGQVSTLSIGKLTIDLPSDVEISRGSLSNMSKCVADYNSNLTSTERSGSITDPNSVHYLWRQIFEEILITKVDTREPENQTRVVYEWEIFDPRSGDRKYIDFAFTEGACAHYSWLRYRGGLEFKVNPKPLSDGSNMASGTVNTLGQKQALSRSASCIFACIAASDWVALPRRLSGRAHRSPWLFKYNGINVTSYHETFSDFPGGQVAWSRFSEAVSPHAHSQRPGCWL